MPGMTGTDFANHLLQIRPNLAIILTTGYSANLTREQIRTLGIRDLLAKPHTLDALGSMVHEVLAQASSATPGRTMYAEMLSASGKNKKR